MPQLVPHLLLRTDAPMSNVAIALRDGGYVVTKVRDDETALELVATLHVDAVCVELPSFNAIAFAKKLRTRFLDEVPVMVVSPSPDVVRRVAGVTAMSTGERGEHLVTEADLMIARHEASSRAFQKNRDAAG